MYVDLICPTCNGKFEKDYPAAFYEDGKNIEVTCPHCNAELDSNFYIEYTSLKRGVLIQ